jgi:hypothetical protein
MYNIASQFMHFSRLENSFLSHQFEISVFIFLDQSSFCTVVNAGQHLMLDGVCIYMLSGGGCIKSKEGLVARTNVVLPNCKSYLCFIGYQN